jgi:diacylglycerol kinase family enzyme
VERLTSSADHGVLWAGLAALLALSGSRGRRAAIRGLMSLSLASAIANVPAKFLVRRSRPPLTAVPLSRQLRHQPTTMSFPSGHSASAAAFAVGAGLEWPAVALPIGAVAAGVAWGRVHTGVHYPGDVLAGATLGGLAAWALTKPWPVSTPEAERATPPRADAPALPDGAGLVLVVNDGAGSGKGADDIGAHLREGLPSATCVDGGSDITSTLRAEATGARVLGVCGGDGTVNAAAAVALEAGLPLVVVPGGTLNHFACDVGAEDFDAVLEAVRRGEAARVDVAETDQGLFLNTATVGGYPEMVAFREKLENDIGKWPAACIALARTLRRSLPMDVEVDGRRHRLWLLFVGNCAYEPTGVVVASRACVDDGLLDVRMLEASRWSRIRLLLSALAGRLDKCSAYHSFRTTQLDVQLLDQPRPVARDGEVGDAVEAIRFRKRPGALTVYRPL